MRHDQPKGDLLGADDPGEPLQQPEVRAALAENQIAIGANGIPYTPLDMTARGLDQIARASVSYLNTLPEIDRLSEAVADIARRA